MSGNDPVQRVRMYLSERDMYEGQPLYLAALDRLRREGATGATALRGVAGFGAGHRLRPAGASDLTQSLPIVIEWVDRAERVARALPALDDLLAAALITIEELRIYRAVLRSEGPFGERAVGEILARDVLTAAPQMLLRDAVQLMIERSQFFLPVLDEQGHVVGALTPDNIARRGGFHLPLGVLAALAPADRAALLAALPARTLADTMTTDPRVIYVEAAIPLAVGTLVEWGLDALPGIDHDGRFVGLFGVEQALQAALEGRAASDGPIRAAEPPTLVHVVMQRAAPAIEASAPLADALGRLLAVADRFLVVVEAGRPIGILTDAQIAVFLQGPARAAWITALQSPNAKLPPELIQAVASQAVGALPFGAPPTIAELATQEDAIRLMLAHGYERLAVVNDAGQLAGLTSRRGLLRALAQESAG